MGLFDMFKPKKKSFWEKVGSGVVTAGKAVGNFAINEAKNAQKKIQKIEEKKMLWRERYSEYTDERLKREAIRVRDDPRDYAIERKIVLKEELRTRGMIK